MIIKGHRIKEKINKKDFFNIINSYKKNQLKCNPHTFFRFNDKQKQEFINCEKVKIFIIEKEPLLIGLQDNGLYAVYYSFLSHKAIKMILNIKPNSISIITLYLINKKSIPIIK